MTRLLATCAIVLALILVLSGSAKALRFSRDPRYSHHAIGCSCFYHVEPLRSYHGSSRTGAHHVHAITIHWHLPRVGHIHY